MFLLDKKYKIQVFNPYQSDALRKVYLGRAKTDTIDAELIARLARIGNQKETVLPGEGILTLRNLSRFRMELVFQASDVKRKVITVLDVLFPEFEKLKRAAQHSIGATFGQSALVFELKLLLSQVQFLKEQLTELEQEITILLANVDQKLTSIPGIGPMLAAIIIGEIGDLSRFPNVSSVIAYAGLDPTVTESGTITKKRNISKKGSKYLRTAIWQAAVYSLVHNPTLRAFYDKKCSEGKPRQVALGALANKLTRIIYGILRTNKEYQPVM